MNITQKQNGITLVELMVVVAIIGILAGIAYPSYQDSVRKSRRAEAHTGLFALQLAMEKARGSCATYATTIGTSNTCSSKTVSFADNSDYYNYTIVDSSASDYTLTATAIGSQTSDTTCATITLKRDGSQGGSTGGVNCW